MEAQGFRLLETMKVSDDGEVIRLDRHLQRLSHSASALHFSCDLEKIRTEINAFVERASRPSRLRLLVAPEGNCELQATPLRDADIPKHLVISEVQVDSSNPLLRHKTTDRQVYERARSGLEQDVDAILVNERGEATETTRANFAVLRAGQWVTPPISCGLLPGIMREELIERGEIVEGIVEAASIQPGETVRWFNSIRGVVEVTMTAK